MSIDRSDKNRNKSNLKRMASDIASAYLSGNNLPASQVGEAISSVYDTLIGLSEEPSQAPSLPSKQKPAVSAKKSIGDDYLICLEDGKKMKMMKRYLRTTYGMTPEEYRVKWGLPSDYPMVAPSYSKKRSQFAKNIGLGTNRTKPNRAKK